MINISLSKSIKIKPYANTTDLAENVEEYLRFVLQNVDYRELPRRNGSGGFTPYTTTRMHMSDISHSCVRRAPLVALTPPGALEAPSTTGYFISGHLHEDLLISCLEYGHPGEFEYQKELPNLPPEIQAHIDAFWEKERVVLEFKNTSLASRASADYPRAEHKRQVSGYAHYLEQLYPGEPVRALLVYCIRDDPSIVDVFPVPDVYRAEMAGRVQSAVSLLSKRLVPPIPSTFARDRAPCRYFRKDGAVLGCSLHPICWPEPEGGAPVASPLQVDETDIRKIVDELTLIKVNASAANEMSKASKERRREYEGILAPYFDKSESGVLATGHPEYDIKRITIPPSTSYDVRDAIARGYLSHDDAEKIKRVSPGYSYTVLVKKKGIPND